MSCNEPNCSVNFLGRAPADNPSYQTTYLTGATPGNSGPMTELENGQ